MPKIEHAIGIAGTTTELVFTAAELAHIQVVDRILDRARELAETELGVEAWEGNTYYADLRLPIAGELAGLPRHDRLELDFERTNWSTL